MIPYTQQILGDPARGDGHDANGVPGDCFKTCVASLLDLPLDDVPHFVALPDDEWWGALQSFIKSACGDDKVLQWWESIDDVRPWGYEYLIAGGASPRGDFQHAVIANGDGEVVHDPHPSRLGLAGTPNIYFAVASVDAPAVKGA